jgi:hypothetical protein
MRRWWRRAQDDDGGTRETSPALEQAQAGEGASALVSTEIAITARLRDVPVTIGTAIALVQHAEVLHQFGDPDLAVAAAGLAVRILTDHGSGLSARDRSALARAEAIAAGATDGMTVARALGQAPPTGVVTTTQRCGSEDPLAVAGRFAGRAAAIMSTDPAAGLRLGLEAHVLYAHQSELQTLEMRYTMGEHGPAWARTLLLCSRAAEDTGRRDLALDLASWMGGTVDALVPFAFVDPDVFALLRACLAWHADLLRRSGDTAAAENAERALESVEAVRPH